MRCNDELCPCNNRAHEKHKNLVEVLKLARIYKKVNGYNWLATMN
jgi:hypothetical protein